MHNPHLLNFLPVIHSILRNPFQALQHQLNQRINGGTASLLMKMTKGGWSLGMHPASLPWCYPTMRSLLFPLIAMSMYV